MKNVGEIDAAGHQLRGAGAALAVGTIGQQVQAGFLRRFDQLATAGNGDALGDAVGGSPRFQCNK